MDYEFHGHEIELKFMDVLEDIMGRRISNSLNILLSRESDLLNPMYLLSKVDILNREIEILRRYVDSMIGSIKSFKLQNSNILRDKNAFKIYISALLTQSKDIKNFVAGLKKLAIEYKYEKSKDFLSYIKDYEPSDKYLNQDMPWGIYGFINYYLPMKWGIAKHIYSVDVDWLIYLSESMPSDINLSTLDNLPYTTFSVTSIISDYKVNCIFDYDKEDAKLYMAYFYSELKVNKEDEYESCGYSVIDTSGTFDNALKNLESISIDDMASLSVMTNMHTSYWRKYYYKDSKIYTPYPVDPCPLYLDTIYREPESGLYYHTHKAPEPKLYDMPEEVRDHSHCKIFTELMLSLLIFLSSENRNQFISTSTNEITKNRNRKKSKTNKSRENRNQKDDTNSITTFRVGVKEVNLLKKVSESYQNDNNPRYEKLGVRSVSPHIRKAHWHRYWVGQRGSSDRRLVLKFLMPTMVGGKDSATICKENLIGFKRVY